MTLRTRQSHRLRTTIILLTVVMLIAMALLYFFDRQKQNVATPIMQPPKAVVSDKAAAEVKYGLPVRLSIPKVKVDAAISYMGLTPSGEMDVPPDLVTVGWYKFGTKPGEQGSAVIAGHLEGTEDLGVFIDLDKLRTGDMINVQNDRDETVSFVVRETRTYKQDERPNEIFNKTDGSYLNLITCSGTWDNAKKRYSHRYVVFTEKVMGQ
jgi:LPXTG-site transpeptidase (sortase) family protein